MEYTAIKNCYRHYLASYRSVKEPQNVSQIVQNLNTLCETLHTLKKQLQDFTYNTPNEKREITHDAIRHKAIMLFNTDRRFSITE